MTSKKRKRMSSPVPAFRVESRWKVGHTAPRKLIAGCAGALEAQSAQQAPSPDSGPTRSQNSPDAQGNEVQRVRTNRTAQ